MAEKDRTDRALPCLDNPGSMVRDGPLRRLSGFLYNWGPPHALCVFRILLGCYFLAYWLTSLPDVALHFSNEGMAFALFESSENGIHSFRDLIAAFSQAPPPWVAWCGYSFTVTLVVMFTIGLWTRTSLVLYLLMFGFFYFVQIHARDTSFDRLVFIITGLLAMGRADAVYSIDSWRRRRRGLPSVREIPLWPGRLIAVQIAFMYFGAGACKIMSEPWCHGEMLYYTLMGNWASPRAFWIVRNFPYLGLFDVIVLTTMIMEVYVPILLFHRRWQKVVFVWGVLFHVAIADFLNIWPFMFMPLTYVLFLDPGWVQVSCSRIQQFVGRLRAGDMASAFDGPGGRRQVSVEPRDFVDRSKDQRYAPSS